MDLRRLTAGVVYSGWFVSFDRPSTCETEPCGAADMGGLSPRGVPAFIGEGVADSVGTAHLSADLDGLHLAPGTQVTLLILRHLPAIQGDSLGRSRPLGSRTPAWLMGGPPSMVGIVTEDELVAAVVFVDR